MELRYERLSADNFGRGSLEGFVRHQEIERCWRRLDGELVAVQCEFTEDWDEARLREIEESFCRAIAQGSGYGYGAFSEGKVVGYAFVKTERFGSRGQYVELDMFHITEPLRGKGIGRRLFSMACDEARRLGAERLYISAQSSIETIAAYRALGCTEAEEISAERAENEPFDIQMEFKL